MNTKKLIVMSLCVLFVASTALAKWDPGDPYKWVQYPDLDYTGMDVDVTYCGPAGDDFECTTTGPITDIHIWGSWWYDELPMGDPCAVSFLLSIYNNNPHGPYEYSEPNELLWEWWFGQGDFDVRVYASPLSEWYYMPCENIYEPDADWTCWQYNFYIDPCEAFLQEGSPDEPVVYWLVVQAFPEYEAYFGWKTSLDHWMDDAVWSWGINGAGPTGSTSNPETPWNELRYPEEHPFFPESIDLAFVITGKEAEPDKEFGDAPEDAIAYPSTGVWGAFPTCMTCGVATWIQHGLCWAHFELGPPGFDFETDGDAGLCPPPGCFPTYDDDECFQDGDAGLMFPEPYTINMAGNVVPCPGCMGTSLGNTCQTAVWGGNVDIFIVNNMPCDGYVNVLMDWDQNGAWAGFSNCPIAPAWEHVLVDWPVPMGYVGPLSGLLPPNFLIGPNAGYVWTRFTITEVPVGFDWDGSGTFEDGETEDYLLLVEEKEPVKPAMPHLKWSQPPIEWDPNSEKPVYCGWDEPSLREWVEPMWFDCWDCRTQCYGDADCDGYVGPLDLAILQAAMGTRYPEPDYDPCADFDRDLDVDAGDLAIWTSNAGSYPPADCWLQPQTWMMVADDFRCLGPMPITSVHWWGSYFDWEYPGEWPPPFELPIAWRIGFWSNVPADPTGDPNYSYPEELLWQIEVDADRVDIDEVGTDDYYGYYPYDVCYQYTLYLEPDEYFWEDEFDANTTDHIFWLSIAAIYDPCVIPPDHPWGWKTRPWSWMDDAVRFWVGEDPCVGMLLDPYSVDPIKDPIYEESFDVAFELDTDPCWIKWEQAYGCIRQWPHYEDELSMAVKPEEPVTKWIQEPMLDGGIDVDATADMMGMEPPQILADDFFCEMSGPITDIHIWGSWLYDELPFGGDPTAVLFTLSFHDNDPCGPGGWSEPNEPLWWRTFGPGEFVVEGPWIAPQDWFNPCTGWYDPFNHELAWRYSFYIDPCDAFYQEEGNIYWLDLQAMPMDDYARFGWKTSWEQWNDFAVFTVGEEPYWGDWWEIGLGFDLAFEITTEQEEPEIIRLVADDWQCERRTPVTAVVWWGSYLGYGYEACYQSKPMPLPVKPDYFWLSIWTDVPADVDPVVPFSHPNEIIWEYQAYDYDEVLVGYDKHPHGEPNEPVFRYSVRIEDPNDWFCQPDVNSIYWLSVVAVYDVNEPNYDWGWTNHKHMFNDDAVAGYLDISGPEPVWIWEELYDQTEASEDMSFILFTEPDVCCECADYNRDDIVNFIDYADFADDWRWSGQAGGYNNSDLNCNGSVDFYDLAIFVEQWLSSCP